MLLFSPPQQTVTPTSVELHCGTCRWCVFVQMKTWGLRCSAHQLHCASSSSGISPMSLAGWRQLNTKNQRSETQEISPKGTAGQLGGWAEVPPLAIVLRWQALTAHGTTISRAITEELCWSPMQPSHEGPQGGPKIMKEFTNGKSYFPWMLRITDQRERQTGAQA